MPVFALESDPEPLKRRRRRDSKMPTNAMGGSDEKVRGEGGGSGDGVVPQSRFPIPDSRFPIQKRMSSGVILDSH
jgi:hypothetical protein